MLIFFHIPSILFSDDFVHEGKNNKGKTETTIRIRICFFISGCLKFAANIQIILQKSSKLLILFASCLPIPLALYQKNRKSISRFQKRFYFCETEKSHKVNPAKIIIFFSSFIILSGVSKPCFLYSQSSPVLLVADSSKVCEGYILWQDKTKCQLIDRKGKALYNFPGNLCAFIKDKKEIVAHVGGNLVVYNKDLDVIWKKDIYVDHDVITTPENNILAYSVEFDTINHINIRFDNIYCFDSDGNQLYKWSTRDHYSYLLNYMITKTNTFLYKIKRGNNADSILQSFSASLAGIVKDKDDRELFHMNAFSVLPPNASEKKDTVFRHGNIMLSFCNYSDSLQSFIAIVDPVSYKILWHFVEKDGRQIHTPAMLSNGNILMYANSNCRKEFDSSFVIEVDPLTKKVVWDYVEKFPDPQPRCSHGSCQRLPNGNTLISNISGYIYEVTPEKKIVWQWFTNGTRHLYRAFLYTKEQLNWLLNEE